MPEFGADKAQTADTELPASAANLDINAANTARTTATKVLAVQAIDASGNVVGSGGTSMTDDAAFTVATTSVTPVAGTYKSTRDSVDDNDAGCLAMTAKRGLYTTIETPNGDSAMDDTNDAVKVVNATASNLNVTEASAANALTSLQLIDNIVSGAGVNVTQVNGEAIDVGPGTEAAAIRVTLPTDGTGVVGLNAGTNLIGKVSIDQVTANANEVVTKTGSVSAVTNAGTFVVQENGAALTALQLIDDAIYVDDVAFTPGTSKLFAIGLQADETSTDSVDEGDIGTPRMTLDRRVRVANKCIDGPGEPTIDSYTSVGIAAVTGANQSLISAPGADKQIWIYGIQFTTTVAGTVAIQDEDDAVITGVMNFGDKQGMVVNPSGNFAMPWRKVATNKALEADVTTATINGAIQYAIVSV